MKNKFGISETHYKWIKKILDIYLPGVKVQIFGSRARGDFKRYSDLDLLIRAESALSPKTLREIREQFTESSLPFTVDLLELNQLDQSFMQGIVAELQEF